MYLTLRKHRSVLFRRTNPGAGGSRLYIRYRLITLIPRRSNRAAFGSNRDRNIAASVGLKASQHAMVDLSRLLFLGALLLTACTTATSPNLYRVTELVPGISTRDDAIAKLGPPSSTSNIGNSTILQWGGNNSPVHLAISFGMDGRMIQAATDAQKLDQLSGATQ